MKLRILRCEDPSGPWMQFKCFRTKETEGTGHRREEAQREEAQSEGKVVYIPVIYHWFWRWTKRPWAKECSSWLWKKKTNWFSCRASGRSGSLSSVSQFSLLVVSNSLQPHRLGSVLVTPWTGSSTPGFPVQHQLPELAQTQVPWVSDAIRSIKSTHVHWVNSEGREEILQGCLWLVDLC